jgi:hypothetical protein
MLTYELWLAAMKYFEPFASRRPAGSETSAAGQSDVAPERPVRLRSARVRRRAKAAVAWASDRAGSIVRAFQSG